MNQTFKTMTFSTLQSYVVWPNRIRSYSVPQDENTIENSWILKANENILYFRCLENTVTNSRLGFSSCVHGKKVLRTSVSNDHLRNECQKCQLKKKKIVFVTPFDERCHKETFAHSIEKPRFPSESIGVYWKYMEEWWIKRLRIRPRKYIFSF